MSRLSFCELRILCLQICLSILIAAPCFASDSKIRYDHQIRPILAEYCFSCHGPDSSHRQADLRLDFEGSAKEHFINTSGKNEFLDRIDTSDDSRRMPPPETGKKLRETEVMLLRQWIAEGAPYEGHWAFQPILKPDIPSRHRIIEPNGGEEPAEKYRYVDLFINQSLLDHNVSPVPLIQRQQLIRRAAFDLTGLPPTWDEVNDFVNDGTKDAYARLIDRLLASPAYGQRWGRHWLDLARYADTHGGAAIGFTKFPFSYSYRDYVIQAFNNDVPYDRFILEQIAADQLGLQINAPELSALGFLTVGMQFRNRHDVIDDQIDVITRGLMGLTVACARCHDHKFDPIPTKDYYALYASLASSGPPETLPIVRELPSSPESTSYQTQLSILQSRYNEMARDQNEVMRSRLRMQVGLYLREIAKGALEQDLSTEFLSYRTDDLRPFVLNEWIAYLAKFDTEDPVFGPWHRVIKLDADESFGAKAIELLLLLEKENPDTAKSSEAHALASVADKWNPRVLEALIKKNPQSHSDVADAYGTLFAEVHQEWLQALAQSALEALSEESVVPDADPKHSIINSPVHRQIRWHLYGPDTPTAVPEAEAAKLLNRTVSDLLNGKQTAIEDLHLLSPGSPPRAMALQESGQPQQTFVFLRGNPLSRGEKVDPGFLTALSTSEHTSDRILFADGKRRLGLAQSIVDKSNALTRRVLVNWVWQHHFGNGLVRTADDFGTRGRTPTHPELLDYLASQFLEDGWSVKELHRRIMLSKTYQRAAIESISAREVDPDNEYVWRMPRLRLDLESMRDAMLTVSGELDLSHGGRPFDLTATPTVPRRSVYGFINRDRVSDFLSTFDVANPNACTVKRPDTTVPQQTLFALNSSFIQDRAAKVYELSIAAVGSDDEKRVIWLYRRLFGRDPDNLELQLALKFVASETTTNLTLSRNLDKSNSDESITDKKNSSSAATSSNAWNRLIHALLASNEFFFID